MAALFLSAVAGLWRRTIVPEWMLIGFLAMAIIEAAIGWVSFRRVRRIRHQLWKQQGNCEHCGYSLTGNLSGVCPECGTRDR
jgi:hypothetical protein